jgi:hypothetical protein
MIFLLILMSCGVKPTVFHTVSNWNSIIDTPYLKALESRGEYYVSLNVRSLGQEFILHPALEFPFDDQSKEYMESPMLSRVVTFEKHGPRLSMMDVTEQNQHPILLTTFPILNDSEGSIVFDFNQGMTEVFTQGDLTTPGTFRPQWEPLSNHQALVVKNNYISGINHYEEGLAIVQQGIISAAERIPYTMTYYIQPYHNNPEFKSTTLVHEYYPKYGFLSTNYHLNKLNQPELKAQKLDLSKKPFYWDISPKVPPEYHKSIHEALNYWNRVFGEEIFKIARDKTDFPQRVIQWKDNDHSNYLALYTGHLDPRTGESLRSQIYISGSGIKFFKDEITSPLSMTYRGFTQKELSFVTPQRVDEIIQDALVQALVHELGHLFLQHNFAGTHVPLTLKERDSLFKDHIVGKPVSAETLITTTVMDYLDFKSVVLNGAWIKASQGILPYDEEAIGKLYFNKNFNTHYDYCNETHIKDGYLDCETFSTGSVVEQALFQFQENLETVPDRILQSYLKESKDLAKPIFQSTLNISKLLEPSMMSMIKIFRIITGQGKFIAAEFPIGTQNPVYDEIRKNENIKYSVELLNKTPAWINVLIPPTPENYQESSLQRMSALIKGNIEKLFTDASPVSADNRDLLMAHQRELGRTIPQKLLDFELGLIYQENNMPLEDSPLTTAYVEVMEKLAQQVLFSSKDFYTIQSDKHSSSTSLPQFMYSFQSRLSMAGVFRTIKQPTKLWGRQEQQKMRIEMDQMILKVVGKEYYEKPDAAPEEVQKWLLEQVQILNRLAE